MNELLLILLILLLLLVCIILTCIFCVMNKNFKENINISLDNENLIEDKKFTIVICNYNRPWNLHKSIPILYNLFKNAEIIISHGNPKTYYNFKGCINIKEFDNTYGATSRFFSASHSSNDYILFLDDDLIPSKKLVKLLLDYQIKNPISISGPMTRLCNNNGYYMLFYKNYNIILTPCLMTNKSLVINYLKNFDKYKDFLKNSKGNGEDLSFNHNLYTQYNIKPTLIKGYYQMLDTSNGYSSNINHRFIRNSFCKQFYNNIN
jgi:hypothetical protein